MLEALEDVAGITWCPNMEGLEFGFRAEVTGGRKCQKGNGLMQVTTANERWS